MAMLVSGSNYSAAAQACKAPQPMGITAQARVLEARAQLLLDNVRNIHDRVIPAGDGIATPAAGKSESSHIAYALTATEVALEDAIALAGNILASL